MPKLRPQMAHAFVIKPAVRHHNRVRPIPPRPNDLFARNSSCCIGHHINSRARKADLVQQRKRFEITGPNAWVQRLKKSENGHQLEHYPFFRAIRENKDYNEAEQGALSTMTAILGRMATYSGKKVEWEDAFNSKNNLVPYDQDLTMDSIPPVVHDEEGWYPVAVPGKTKVI